VRRVCVDCKALLAADNPERLTPAAGDDVELICGRRLETYGPEEFRGYLCEHHDRCSDWLEKREIDHA
jgi:hypothetical protein